VNSGHRVLFHFLNASAIENRHLALPGHKFNVIALDGNPVPTRRRRGRADAGSGEPRRCFVEMNHPGVWILGAPENPVREGGLGIVIEYANSAQHPAVDTAAQIGLGLPPSSQTAFAAGAHRAAGHDIREGAARLGQIQQLSR